MKLTVKVVKPVTTDVNRVVFGPAPKDESPIGNSEITLRTKRPPRVGDIVEIKFSRPPKKAAEGSK